MKRVMDRYSIDTIKGNPLGGKTGMDILFCGIEEKTGKYLVKLCTDPVSRHDLINWDYKRFDTIEEAREFWKKTTEWFKEVKGWKLEKRWIYTEGNNEPKIITF